MTKKLQILTILFLSSAIRLNAQDLELRKILSAVEQNNEQLKALKLQHRAQREELQKLNNLNDPVVSAFYMPFASHTDVTYTEYQVDQTFEFPTVYASRKTIIGQKNRLLDLEYQEKRQEILKEAKALVLEVIYTNKELEELKGSLEIAEALKDTQENQFENGKINLIELNKCKLMYLQEQFSIQNMESEKKTLLRKLRSLNGDIAIDISVISYPTSLAKYELDSLWDRHLQKDAQLLKLKQEELIAKQNVALSKNETLPNLGIGYNSQGLPNEHFGGLYASLSVPVFSSQHHVKSAKLGYEYELSASERQQALQYAELTNDYENYLNSLDIYRQYISNMESLNGEGILLDAYEKEELSLDAYFAELEFYKNAKSALLKMEFDLQIMLNNLTAHNL